MDSYRPNQGSSGHNLPPKPPPNKNKPNDWSRQQNRGPPRGPPPFQFGQDSRGDSYRPRDSYNRDQFQAAQFNLGNHQTTFSATAPPKGPRNNNNRNQNGRGRGQNAPRRLQHQGPPRRPPPKVSSRPLLDGKRSPTPEQMVGMGSNQPKFKPLEEISEEDKEEEADDSDDGDELDNLEPQRKKINFSLKVAVDEAPKWSNPDPYTALPPPNDAGGKRTDVVKLIRKSRVTDLKDQTANGDSSDFISLDEDASIDSDGGVGVDVWSSLQNRQNLDRSGKGSRKRTREEISDQLTPMENLQEERDHLIKGRKKKPPKKTVGLVDSSWYPHPSYPATPWFVSNTAKTPNGNELLHKEICDFYNYVRPQTFENDLRSDLVKRVQNFLDRNYKGCQVQCFGSFAAGIYLPNADMDLVVRSREFMRGGPPTVFRSPSSMHKLKNKLVQAGEAKEDSATVIPKAKVPLVKYVDRLTNLRVDISFENDTGPTANRTYADWTAKYPAMQVLVSLVKQFLMMRGLNEVQFGGIGGFTVTCLVVSFLHLECKHFNPINDLGGAFLRFLDHFGKKFNTTRTGIRFDPTAYFSKANKPQFLKKDKSDDRLCIIDPNREDNNISGGSSNAGLIFMAFADAADVLRERLQEVMRLEQPQSVLECLYAGNYTHFENQRARLKQLSGIR